MGVNISIKRNRLFYTGEEVLSVWQSCSKGRNNEGGRNIVMGPLPLVNKRLVPHS